MHEHQHSLLLAAQAARSHSGGHVLFVVTGSFPQTVNRNEPSSSCFCLAFYHSNNKSNKSIWLCERQMNGYKHVSLNC